MPLTDDEKKALSLSGELMTAFNKLPVLHPADVAEMIRDIHDIQNRILGRVGMRELSREKLP